MLDQSVLTDLSAMSFSSGASFERFHARWQPIITSGEDYCNEHLNERATWLLPQDDGKLNEVARLQKGVGELGKMRPQHTAYSRQKFRSPVEFFAAH